MKALTLTQPWATLVASGAKTIETRSWSTKYRGLLAVHAAASRPALGQVGPYVIRDLAGDRVIHGEGTPLVTKSLPLGAVIATCRLVDVVRTDTMPGFERIVSWGRLGMEDEPPGQLDWIDEHDPPCDYDGLVWDLKANRPLGDFTPGRHAWLLADIEPTAEPVPVKGALGLWEWAA
jgi:activating signal cointegrator 1